MKYLHVMKLPCVVKGFDLRMNNNKVIVQRTLNESRIEQVSNVGERREETTKVIQLTNLRCTFTYPNTYVNTSMARETKLRFLKTVHTNAEKICSNNAEKTINKSTV